MNKSYTLSVEEKKGNDVVEQDCLLPWNNVKISICVVVVVFHQTIKRLVSLKVTEYFVR